MRKLVRGSNERMATRIYDTTLGISVQTMQQRSYLLLANWIVRAAHFLAARGLLSLTAARIAFRGSGSLSRRSMAIYRYERATSKDRLRMT
jgi:hypothetical protein